MALLLTELSHSDGRMETADASSLRESLFSPQRKVDLKALVAVEDKQVVATLLYYPGYDVLTRTHGYHLGDMMIAVTHQRKGIGRMLMTHVAEEILRDGGSWATFTVNNDNARACSFHDALGMVRLPVQFYAANKTQLNQLVSATNA